MVINPIHDESKEIKEMKRKFNKLLLLLKNSKSYGVIDEQDPHTEIHMDPLDHLELEKLLE